MKLNTVLSIAIPVIGFLHFYPVISLENLMVLKNTEVINMHPIIKFMKLDFMKVK